MPPFTVGETDQCTSGHLSVNHGNIWKGSLDYTLKNNLSQVMAGSHKELGEYMNHDVRTVKGRRLSPVSGYYWANWSSNEIQILYQEGQVYRMNHSDFCPRFCHIWNFFMHLCFPIFCILFILPFSTTLGCIKSSTVSIGVKSLASAIYTSCWGRKTSGNMVTSRKVAQVCTTPKLVSVENILVCI